MGPGTHLVQGPSENERVAGGRWGCLRPAVLLWVLGDVSQLCVRWLLPYGLTFLLTCLKISLLVRNHSYFIELDLCSRDAGSYPFCSAGLRQPKQGATVLNSEYYAEIVQPFPKLFCCPGEMRLWALVQSSVMSECIEWDQ